jgi:hypothetical protein
VRSTIQRCGCTAKALRGKGAARLRLAAFDDLHGRVDDLHGPAHELAQILRQLPCVGGIGPDQGQARQVGAVESHGVREQARSVTVLHLGGADHDLEHEALGIHHQMPLAPTHLFVRVVAARTPPFDWS